MRLIAAIAAGLTLAIASPAVAADAAKPAQGGAIDFKSGMVSAHAIVTYYWAETGYGLGARYQIPILKEGLLKNPNMKDDIAVDAGFDFVHVNFGQYPTSFNTTTWTYTWEDLTWNALIPTVGVLWNFWLTPQLAVYPKVDMGFAIGFWSVDWMSGYGPNEKNFFIQGAAGALYKLNDKMSLKAELGSGMLRLGAAFQL